MAVETIRSPERPSLLRRSLSWIAAFRPSLKAVTIYVCCPECVAKVKSDPATYLVKVIGERAGWKQ